MKEKSNLELNVFKNELHMFYQVIFSFIYFPIILCLFMYLFIYLFIISAGLVLHSFSEFVCECE